MKGRSALAIALLAVVALAACDQFSLFAELDKLVTPEPLRVVPSSAIVSTDTNFNFAAIGGTPPYDFAVVEGGGYGSVALVGQATGLYTAPGSELLATVRLTDALGTTSDALVNVLQPQGLTLNPSSITLGTSNSYAFYALGGTPPYTYSVASGLGSIDAGTGLFTASGSAGAVTLRVTDDGAVTADATVSVVAVGGPVAISPDLPTVEQGKQLQFAASGGTPGYTYGVVPGTGVTIVSGLFTASSSATPGDTYTVTVTASVGGSDNTMVTIAPAAPTDLVADGTAGGPQDIQLTWTDNASGESGYEVWEKQGSGAFALIFTTAADATGYLVGGISPGTPCTYQVRAVKDPGIYSAYSELAFDIPNR